MTQTTITRHLAERNLAAAVEHLRDHEPRCDLDAEAGAALVLDAALAAFRAGHDREAVRLANLARSLWAGDLAP